MSSNARRITRRYTQNISASPGEILPLLDPVREREWLEGWDCSMVYSDSGVGEPGCIFTTHNADGSATVWIMTRRDEESMVVEFVMVTPGSRVGHLCVRLEESGDRSTKAHIAYTFTSLGESGDHFIEGYTEEVFNERMEWWEKSMNHFLLTGRQLSAPAAGH
ncbi:MAG TPA: hypothetical protein VNH22_06935 [Blastocatellia bacterium]|jgi:hypothetical protein|nr:hypothetical protein [Blastocatellia bacterium]